MHLKEKEGGRCYQGDEQGLYHAGLIDYAKGFEFYLDVMEAKGKFGTGKSYNSIYRIKRSLNKIFLVKRPARRLLQQVWDDGGLSWDGGSGGELWFWIYSDCIYIYIFFFFLFFLPYPAACGILVP